MQGRWGRLLAGARREVQRDVGGLGGRLTQGVDHRRHGLEHVVAGERVFEGAAAGGRQGLEQAGVAAVPDRQDRRRDAAGCMRARRRRGAEHALGPAQVAVAQEEDGGATVTRVHGSRLRGPARRFRHQASEHGPDPALSWWWRRRRRRWRAGRQGRERLLQAGERLGATEVLGQHGGGPGDEALLDSVRPRRKRHGRVVVAGGAKLGHAEAVAGPQAGGEDQEPVQHRVDAPWLVVHRPGAVNDDGQVEGMGGGGRPQHQVSGQQERRSPRHCWRHPQASGEAARVRDADPQLRAASCEVVLGEAQVRIYDEIGDGWGMGGGKGEGVRRGAG